MMDEVDFRESSFLEFTFYGAAQPSKQQNQTLHIAKILARRKTEEEEDSGGTKLKRVLGLGDLTMLSVGSTLGLGVYVLAGSVARNEAGPAVTVSFLVAAIASAFAGMCYAEFAARVPKAGSAYVYSYVTVGEFIAFVIGWNLILEYVIGTASVARGLSNYLDSLVDHSMSNALTEALPIGVSWLSPYPDFLSCGMILVLSLLLAWGVKESSWLNNIFTAVNLLTVATVIIVGAFYIDIGNWTLDKSKIPDTDSNGHTIKGGNGGFLPFGISGIFAGAAKCFFGFVGFDSIATTGEEAKNPKRDIPLAIILSLLVVFLAYFGIGAVLTLMWPYYLQNADAPLPYVFGQINLPAVKYIVSGGAIFALCTSMIGAMFPLPRVLYAMSHDGLLYDILCYVSPSNHTPLFATLAGGVLAGLLAAIFNLDQLVDMMSIGTLLAYSIVAVCVVVLRYKDPNPVMYEHPIAEQPGGGMAKSELQTSTMSSLREIFNLSMIKYPTHISETIAYWALIFFLILALVFCIVIETLLDEISDGSAWAIGIVSVLAAAMLVAIFIIHRQPQGQVNLYFKAPLLPWLPCASVLINLYLMVKLDINTWIRFIVWLIIGLLIYVFYSIPNSVEGIKSRQLKAEAKKHSKGNTITRESTKI